MSAEQNRPVTIIELDDPTPRWASVATLLAALLVVGILIAPFGLDTTAQDAADSSPGTVTASRQVNPVCRPAIDLPAFAEPLGSVAMPSWMRICDWFSEPESNNPFVVPQAGEDDAASPTPD